MKTSADIKEQIKKYITWKSRQSWSQRRIGYFFDVIRYDDVIRFLQINVRQKQKPFRFDNDISFKSFNKKKCDPENRMGKNWKFIRFYIWLWHGLDNIFFD